MPTFAFTRSDWADCEGPTVGMTVCGEWFAHLKRLRHEHRIVLSDTRVVAEGSVFAVGSLSLGAEPDIGPFCAQHRIDGALIIAAHQYLTDPDLVEHLGLFP